MELTPVLINEFMEKIIVHAPDKSSGARVQGVKIYLNFIGRFDAPMPERTEKEIAEQEKLRKKRGRATGRKNVRPEHKPRFVRTVGFQKMDTIRPQTGYQCCFGKTDFFPR